MNIQLINGKFHINNKTYFDATAHEKNELNKFFKELKQKQRLAKSFHQKKNNHD